MDKKEQYFIKKLKEEMIFNQLKDTKKDLSVKELENMFPEYIGFLDFKIIFSKIVDYLINGRRNK